MAKGKFTRKTPTLAQLQASIKAQAPSGWTNAEAKFPLEFMDKTPRAPRKANAPRKHEEHNLQSEIVTYLKTCCPDVLVSSSCNGELWPMSQNIEKGRFFGWMNKLKSRGLLTGDPDLRLTWKPARCIFIEMKKRKGGVTSDAQNTIGERLREQGFKVYVLEGGIDGLKEIISLEAIPCRDSHYSTPF